jgi:hypothetical protein
MTNTDDNEARYAEILRRIEARGQTSARMPQQMKLASILDGLNAMGYLDDARKKRLKPFSVFGPKALRGHLGDAGSTRHWAGALIWFKPRGYHYYHTLTLLGIWALDDDAAVRVLIGSKTLEFDSPVYNPESYHREIKRGFELYYRGDGAPPPETNLRFSRRYDPGERLAMRDAVEAALIAWAAELSAS